MQLEFCDDFFESFLVRHAYQDNGWSNRIDALGERIGHFTCGVIGLHELCSNGEVLPDEDVEVPIYLMHVLYPSPVPENCQEFFAAGRQREQGA
jgi:hypothetical protein